MARTPNYDFERRERERLKKLKKAARAEARQKPDTEGTPDEEAPPDESGSGTSPPDEDR